MAQRPPVIDDRSAAKIRKETREQLHEALKGYGWTAPSSADVPYGGEACNAIVHIFSQYCHHIVDRINRNREKSFLAFLDLLGNARIPAQPARAVVTFTLSEGARGRLLPAGTRLQSVAEGSNPACNYETEHDVWLSNLSLHAISNDKENGSCTFQFMLSTTAQPLEGMPLELYIWLDSPLYEPAIKPTAPADIVHRQLKWELSAKEPKSIAVEDETMGLTRSGTIRLMTPSAEYWQAGEKASSTSFCLTVRNLLKSELEPQPLPRLQRVALNSVSVIQATTVVGEVLGSSAGQGNQRYQASQTPVLQDPVLTVLEVVPGNAAELQVADANWVVWQETPDFCASGPMDRHYVLDHQTGEVHFGDGNRGMAPPAGARNIRFDRYRAGGGAAGNVAAGLLKIPVSNTRDIASVTNFFAATGGAEAERQEALLDRAPRSLRHRQRAVTQDDYEDLALQASTEVARAKCVPLHDLLSYAYEKVETEEQKQQGAGKVSVIIVPRSTAPKPLPTLDLIRRVQAYLRERACVEAVVTVSGPLYLPVHVKVSLEIESNRYTETIRQEVLRRLDAYLHPLTGGRNGTGWSWGREPHVSDFYAVLNGIPHVRYVELHSATHDQAADKDVFETRRFLVCAGTPTVTISAH